MVAVFVSTLTSLIKTCEVDINKEIEVRMEKERGSSFAEKVCQGCQL